MTKVWLYFLDYMHITLLDLGIVPSEPPHLYKQVTQEVVRHERSPEVLREMDHLKAQLNELVNGSGRAQEQLIRLQGERDEWRRERSKVETKTVNKEVVRYEKDPVLEQEAQRLRQELREAAQKRRTAEDTVSELQNKYNRQFCPIGTCCQPQLCMVCPAMSSK